MGILWGPHMLRWSCGVHRSWGVKDLHPCTIEACRMPLHAILAFKRRTDACSGRSMPRCSMFLALNASSMLVSGVQCQLSSVCIPGIWTPGCCLFWAFNARSMLCSGVERQPNAPYWRLNASKSFLQGVIFLLLFFILFLIFVFILWLHMIMNLIKHEKQ